MPIQTPIIVGPTAVGKSALAFNLAEEINAWIINVDSRQAYTQMDIGTGKDISDFRHMVDKINNQTLNYYQKDGVRVYGLDLVDPDETLSSGLFYQRLQPVIKHGQRTNQPLIFTGGTGQYLDVLMNPPATLTVPPNPELRQELEALDREQLQDRLQQADSSRWSQMNPSDKANPRRLIRAIEVAKAPKAKSNLEPVIPEDQQIWIGLKFANTNLAVAQISQRVENRVEAGFDNEVRRIYQNYKAEQLPPALTALGYQTWHAYQQGRLDISQAKKLWIRAEVKYHKRQLTYWQRHPQIRWFAISSKQDIMKLSRQLLKEVYGQK